MSSPLCLYWVWFALKAAERNSEIREVLFIYDTRRDLRGTEIGDRRGSRVGREARVDQWDGDASDRAYLDRHRVVEDPASVRESRQVAPQDAENIRIGRRWDGHIEPQQIR